MYITKKPADTALTLQMLRPPSPFAAWARYDAKAIFYFKLFELDVKLVVASGTNKISRVRSL